MLTTFDFEKVFSAGTDVAVEAGDVVLVGNDPRVHSMSYLEPDSCISSLTRQH